MGAHYIPARVERTRLAAQYLTRRAVLTHFQRDGDKRFLFVPSFAAVEVGQIVELKVAIGNTQRNFYVCGTVHTVHCEGRIRSGYTLAFESPEQDRGISHLIAFCSRHQEAARRVRAALPLNVIAGPATAFDAVLRDASVTGAFIETTASAPVSVGSKVHFEVRHGLFRMRRTRLELEIVWHGVKHGKPGFGGRFIGIGPDEVAGLIRALELR